MNFYKDGFSKISCRNALLLSLIIAAGCSKSTSSDINDVAALYGACKSLKKSDVQSACLAALSKLAGNEAVENLEKQYKRGATKEEITFKGISLDQPNQVERLMAMCVENKDNLEHISGGWKFENKCKISPNGRTWFLTDYGLLVNTPMYFWLDDVGALSKVWKTLGVHDVSKLVIVLTEKYGDPSIQEDEIRNGLGSVFDRQIFSWFDNKGNRIVIHTRDKKIDEGRFEIQSSSFVLGSFNKEIEEISKGAERL